MLTCIVGKNNVDTFTYKEQQLREWSNKKMLKCPVCGEKMLYCHGDFKIPYFRHEKNSDCLDIYSEGVTEEHIKGIKILYDWLNNQKDVKNLQLEKWIPETKQRPDIYFTKNGKEYVIEFQCSPISTKYNERHDLYKLNNIQDMWILGMKKYNFPSLKYIENNIYNNVLFEKRMKTIEIEVLNSSNNLIYIDINNNRMYITNNKETIPATREKVGYYSGTSYEVKMKVIYAMDLTSRSIDILSLDNIINYDSTHLKDNKYYKSIINNEIEFIEKYINDDVNLEIIDRHDNEDNYNIQYKDINNKTFDIYYDYGKNIWKGFKIKNKNNNFTNTEIEINEEYLYVSNKTFSTRLNKNEFSLTGNTIEDNTFIKNRIKQLFEEYNKNKFSKMYKEPIYNMINNFSSFIQNAHIGSKIYLDESRSYINKNKALLSLNFEYEDNIFRNEYNEELDKLNIKNILDNFNGKINKYTSKNNVFVRNLLIDINAHMYNNLKWCIFYGEIISPNFEDEEFYTYKLKINCNCSELKIKYNTILYNNDKYVINENNARKILINIISNYIRELKYGRGINNG